MSEGAGIALICLTLLGVGICIGGAIESGVAKGRAAEVCSKTCGYRTVAAAGKASAALYCLCSEADGGVSTEVGK